MMIASIAAHEKRVIATTEVKGSFLHADMTSEIYMI